MGNFPVNYPMFLLSENGVYVTVTPWSNLKSLVSWQTTVMERTRCTGRYGRTVVLLGLYWDVIIIPCTKCKQICLQASHEDSCDFMIILCPSCKELMRANEQEHHNERECPERTLYCKYCKEPFHLKNIKVRLLLTAALYTDRQHFICDVIDVISAVYELRRKLCTHTHLDTA